MLEKSSVELSNTAKKTDGSVTSGLPLVLLFFKDRSDVGCLPFRWHPSRVPALIEDEQKGSVCSRPKVLQHFVGDSVWAGSLLQLLVHGIFKLTESHVLCHVGGPFNSSSVQEIPGFGSDFPNSCRREVHFALSLVSCVRSALSSTAEFLSVLLKVQGYCLLVPASPGL